MDRDRTDTSAGGGRHTAGRERTWCWPYLLAGAFLPLISFPLVLALLMWRLRRHVDRRLRSPAFRSERFATPPGQEIIRRLHKCRGWFRNPVAVILLTQYVFFPSVIALPLVALPAMLPNFSYREILRGTLGVEPAWSLVPCLSRAHYKGLSRDWLRDVVCVGVAPMTDAEASDSNLPVVTGEVFPVHSRIRMSVLVACAGAPPPPYEGRCRDRRGTWHVVRAVQARYQWDGTEGLGLLLYLVFLPLQVGSAMLLCCGLWLRFARHRVVEVLAAAHARDDADMPERVLPLVRSSNSRLLRAALLFAPLQGLVLAFYGPSVLRGHFLEERAFGIDEALAAP